MVRLTTAALTAIACLYQADAFHTSATFGHRTSLNAISSSPEPQPQHSLLQKAFSASVASMLLWNTCTLQDVNNNNLLNDRVVSAKEMASGSGSRVNKDADSLLRYGLPIKSKEVS